MKKIIVRLCPSLFAAVFVFWSPAASQENKDSLPIEITSQISSPKVTLKDTLTLTLRLSWPGEKDRFLIEQFAPPEVENLSISGTRAETRSYLKEANQFSLKEYIFRLEADSLGPARIEPVILNYYDTQTDKAGSFTTPAYQLEVIPPRKPGAHFLWFLVASAALFGLGYLLRIFRRLKIAPGQTRSARTLEEEILAEATNFSSGDSRELAKELRKIVIKYLEYKLSATLGSKTTAEILENLGSFSSEKRQALRELLEASDRARFVPDAELEPKEKLLARLKMLLEPESV